jgi:probable rRNA maturation factor
MVKVSVSKQSNYPVGAIVIKKRLSAFLQKQGIVSEAEVSVAIVGESKMVQIGKRYLDPSAPLGTGRKLHNVLSFTPTEAKGDFVYPPDGIIHLGEIIICYPLAVKEAGEENVLINDRVCELVEHGALHLLGIHHEDDI